MDYRSDGLFSSAAAAAALTAHQHYHHYPGPTQAATYGYASQYAHTHPYYHNGYMSGLGSSNSDVTGLFSGSPSTSPGSNVTNPNGSPLSNAISGLTGSPPMTAALPTSPNSASVMTSPFSLAQRCGSGRQWMGSSCKESYPYHSKGPSFYTGSGLASLVAQAASLPTVEKDTPTSSCSKNTNSYTGSARQNCRQPADPEPNSMKQRCPPEQNLQSSTRSREDSHELPLEPDKYFDPCFDSSNGEAVAAESTQAKDTPETRDDASPQSCAESTDTRHSQGTKLAGFENCSFLDVN